MIDGLAALLVRESRFVVTSHDALPSPLPDLATKIRLPTFTHLAFPAESLQARSASFSLVHSIFHVPRTSPLSGLCSSQKLLLHDLMHFRRTHR